MKIKIKKISLLLALSLFIISCGYNGNELTIENSFGDKLNRQINVINKFRNNCKQSNLIEGYSVSNIKLKNLRNNYLQLNTFWNNEGMGYSVKEDKVIIGIIYDTSYVAYSNDYGYIFCTDEVLLNKTEEQLYFIFWENGNIQDKFSHIYKQSSLIDSSTISVYTNLDTNIVKSLFKYKGKINEGRVEKIELEFSQDKDNDFFDTFEIVIRNE